MTSAAASAHCVSRRATEAASMAPSKSPALYRVRARASDGDSAASSPAGTAVSAPSASATTRYVRISTNPNIRGTRPLCYNSKPMGEPLIVPRSDHALSRKLIDPEALKVLYRLNQANYTAYLVGGGVRDLL